MSSHAPPREPYKGPDVTWTVSPYTVGTIERYEDDAEQALMEGRTTIARMCFEQALRLREEAKKKSE